jgi:ornithine decarboxylase
MNCLLYDHATLSARALRSPLLPPASLASDAARFQSTVFGPTCDGLDVCLTDYPLPELRNGDWLVFPSMGAYTACGASDFNGIKATEVHTFYVCSEAAN